MKILVVGGGVGGLSATLALRGQGFDVDMIEKNPRWDVYGVGIIQPDNALRALAAIGLADACVEAGFPIRGDRAYLVDGETLIGQHEWEPLVPGLPPGNGLTRPRLHAILSEAVLASGADVRVGTVLTELEQGEDDVTVAFSDGETRVYDAVVGADGLYSQVREIIVGPDVKPRYTGQVCWRYNLPRIDGLEEIRSFLGPSGSTGLVPLAPDLMYIYLVERPEDETEARGRGLAERFRGRLTEFGGDIAAIREQITVDEEVVLRPLENIIVPKPWHRGRTVLIGDASHGTTPQAGQGAAQAIEDAIALAEELARDVPVEAAFTAFTDRRFDRCEAIVLLSQKIGEWELDHSLPIEPPAVLEEALRLAALPF